MSLGCDVSKHCLSQNCLRQDEAAGTAISLSRLEAANVCVLGCCMKTELCGFSYAALLHVWGCSGGELSPFEMLTLKSIYK